MDTDRKLTDKTGKKPRTLSYKYSFRLNEEQNIRFNELLCKAGSEHNRSRFIVKRIFAEEFVVIKRDPSKTQFIARLNDLLCVQLGVNENPYPVLDELLGKLIPKNKLRVYGMKPEEIQGFTSSVLQTQQRLLANNYVSLSEEEIREIYKVLY